ncbi:MAG: nuclear transport factor 2 family protein [Reichenbachiella sp.]|uniref:nuclear transport factor 2 family protein n=1 Tax=Reichenbachiella sp. TaxID=2184521 RepID=UPI00326640FC
MTKSALETVQAFQQSLGSGSADWENLLADNISFIGPVDQVYGKAANIELNKNFFPLIKGYQAKTALENGNHAVMEGSYTISTPTGGTLDLHTVEIFEVSEGQIQNIRIYYDAQAFRTEFSIPLNK